jgi:hypothetical protein
MGSYKDHSFPEFWDMYINALEGLFGKEKLLILGSLPVWLDDLPKLIVKDYVQEKDFLGPSFNGLFDKGAHLDDVMAKDLTARSIKFLSSISAFCSSLGCIRTAVAENGDVEAVTFDGAHLSSVGSNILAKYIVLSVQEASLEKQVLLNN